MSWLPKPLTNYLVMQARILELESRVLELEKKLTLNYPQFCISCGSHQNPISSNSSAVKDDYGVMW